MIGQPPSPRPLPLLLAVAALSCSASGSPPSPLPSPPRPQGDLVPLVRPARYLVPDAAWVERTDGALDRVVANGRRMEVRGVETVRLGPAEPEVFAGAMAPSWAGSGPSRYVFWKSRELYGAESFTGELRKLATLPSEPQRAFDWLDGTGLLLAGGAVVVPVSGGPPAPLKVPVVSSALAADGRRAAAVSALGHTFLTIDGGASYRDVSADLGQVSFFEVRDEDLIAGLSDGRERFINRAGAIAQDRAASGSKRGKPAADDVDLWPHGAAIGALSAAVRGGLPLPDGGAVIASRGVVGRLDLATLRTTSVATLSGVDVDADCFAFRAADGALLACADRDRATVVDLRGAPRIERTFDLSGAPDLDRFAGFDGEALGYLGACDGSPKRTLEIEGMSGGEGYNNSPSRSEVFCVRKGHEEWIEHRVDPGEASDLVAWIPRASGGAVALVARQGNFIPDAERIEVRGGLRIVRVARNEPPLAFPPYGYRGSVVLNRSLRVGADDVIEGWLPVTASLSQVAVNIDAGGHPRAFASPPRANQIFTTGMMAITQTEDGRLFETVNGGHRWVEIEPPPGMPVAVPSQCSPVGCQMGPFVRIGWTGADEPGKAMDPEPSRGRAARERNHVSRPQVAAPLLRLDCSFAGPAEGKRTVEMYGFGATAWSQPRGAMPVRLGSLGVAMFPYNGPQIMTSGDVDVAWVSPLDLTGAIRRTTISLARAGLGAGMQRAYEVKLGYLVDAEGGLDMLTTGYHEACLASLLDAVGITRSLGGCAEDPSIGVDLGGKVLVLHPSGDALVVSAADAPPRRRAAPLKDKGGGARLGEGAPPIPVALRELARAPIGAGLRGFTFGAGVRDGAPVVVTVDVHGAAILSSVDPVRGTLGPEELLRPLTAAALGSDATCAGVRAGEARVVLSFDTEIGLARASLRGVFTTGTAGVAVLRWSKERACLDAVEISVRDERFDADLTPYDGPGSVRKLIARFAGASKGLANAEARPTVKGPANAEARPTLKGAGAATLLLITNGMELRQPIVCKGVVAGVSEGDGP
jgi:hypothetical protein